MFQRNDIIRLKQRSESENKSLKIKMGTDYIIVEPDVTLNFLKTNQSLIQIKDNLDVVCEEKIINTDLITSISLLDLP